MDLLEHVGDDEANPPPVLITRWENMIDELHLPVDVALRDRVNFLGPHLPIFQYRSVHYFGSINKLLHPVDLVLVVDAEDLDPVELITVDVSLNGKVLLSEESNEIILKVLG